MPLLDDPPGGRRSHRTGRDAPAVHEVGIDLRRDSRLIRHEWCHRVGTAAVVSARTGRCAGGREGNRECGPRERNPLGALHWASLVKERDSPRLCPYAHPASGGFPRVWADKPHPGVDRARSNDYFVRYAPRDHRPRRSRRAHPALPDAAPPAGAQRLGRGAALVGSRSRPQRSRPQAARCRGRARSRLRSARRRARHAAWLAGCPGQSGAPVRRHPVARDHAPGLRAVPHRRSPARARGRRGQARRHAQRHGAAHDLRAARRERQRLALALRPHRHRAGGREAARARDCCCGGAHPAAARASRSSTATSPCRSSRRSSTRSTTCASQRAATRRRRARRSRRP